MTTSTLERRATQLNTRHYESLGWVLYRSRGNAGPSSPSRVATLVGEDFDVWELPEDAGTRVLERAESHWLTLGPVLSTAAGFRFLTARGTADHPLTSGAGLWLAPQSLLPLPMPTARDPCWVVPPTSVNVCALPAGPLLVQMRAAILRS